MFSSLNWTFFFIYIRIVFSVLNGWNMTNCNKLLTFGNYRCFILILFRFYCLKLLCFCWLYIHWWKWMVFSELRNFVKKYFRSMKTHSIFFFRFKTRLIINRSKLLSKFISAPSQLWRSDNIDRLTLKSILRPIK